jgi:hypothetical protein
MGNGSDEHGRIGRNINIWEIWGVRVTTAPAAPESGWIDVGPRYSVRGTEGSRQTVLVFVLVNSKEVKGRRHLLD